MTAPPQKEPQQKAATAAAAQDAGSVCWCPCFEPRTLLRHVCRNCGHSSSEHAQGTGKCSSTKHAKPQKSDDKHRARVVDELLATERTYIDGLRKLGTLCAAANLSEADAAALRCGTGAVCELQCELQAELEQCVRASRNPADSPIGEPFLHFATAIRALYKEPTVHYNDALAVLARLCKQPDFLRTAERVMGVPAGSATAESVELAVGGWLISAVQRLPRYVLLLGDYQRHCTNPAAARRAEEAMKAVQDVVVEVNAHIKREENISKMAQLSHALLGKVPQNLVEAHRSYIAEYEVQKLTTRGPVNCHLFVFSDLVVYAHTKIAGYWSCRGWFELAACWVRRMPDSSQYRNIFQIVGKEKTWTYYSDDKDVTQKCVETITKCIKKLVEHNPGLARARSAVEKAVMDPKFDPNQAAEDEARAKDKEKAEKEKQEDKEKKEKEKEKERAEKEKQKEKEKAEKQKQKEKEQREKEKAEKQKQKEKEKAEKEKQKEKEQKEKQKEKEKREREKEKEKERKEKEKEKEKKEKEKQKEKERKEKEKEKARKEKEKEKEKAKKK